MHQSGQLLTGILVINMAHQPHEANMPSRQPCGGPATSSSEVAKDCGQPAPVSQRHAPKERTEMGASRGPDADGKAVMPRQKTLGNFLLQTMSLATIGQT